MQIDDWVFATFCLLFTGQLVVIIYWLRRAAKALEWIDSTLQRPTTRR